MTRTSFPDWICRFISVALSLVFAGCAATGSTKAPVVLPSVGPSRPELAIPKPPEGRLIVYPEAEPAKNSVEYPTFATYNAVTVRRLDGTVVQRFYNNEMIELTVSEGKYLVETIASPMGAVRIPVTIEANRKTKIDLSDHLKSEFRDYPDDALVKLADGRVVGYRSRSAAEQ